ncbi:MAG: trehalose-phosphatase [Clostridia bacterium]
MACASSSSRERYHGGSNLPLSGGQTRTCRRGVTDRLALVRREFVIDSQSPALVVVTNREPWLHRATLHGTVLRRTPGGVVSALDPVLRHRGGVWIAWGSGERDWVEAPDGRVAIPPRDPRYMLYRVRLTEDEVRGYYLDYSNSGLWPLCHLAVERVRFYRNAWNIYQDVNRKFAEAILDSSVPADTVWSHDYQLALVPGLVRSLRPNQRIVHFWHIPWPPTTLLRLCPNREDIMEGLLGADVLGFQTEDDCRRFLDSVQQLLRHRVDMEQGTVDLAGRMVRVMNFPISIDTPLVASTADLPATRRLTFGLRKRVDQRDLVLGVAVDRLDYSKGILPRLEALDMFFLRYPHRRGQVVLLQVVAPSRSDVPDYALLGEQVQEAVDDLNRRWGTSDWMPVISIPGPLDLRRLAALYRAADFFLVSSLMDGMNLVAKEFVAAQLDQRGVLLLSETAGAIAELEDALPINPLDPEGFADTLEEAIQMPAAERAARLERMRTRLEEYTVQEWAEDVLASVEMTVADAALARILQARQQGKQIVWALDVDGTLVEFAPHPDAVVIPGPLLDTLKSLHRTAHTPVLIISGRSEESLRALMGNEFPGLLMGHHGLDSAPDTRDLTPPQEWRAEFLRLERDWPGAWLEDKGPTWSFHWRGVDPHRKPSLLETLAGLSDRLRHPAYRTRFGNEVLDVYPLAANKGTALRNWLVRTYGPEWDSQIYPVAMGDDTTDKDLFLAVGKSGLSIAVGARITGAALVLDSPAAVRRLLARASMSLRQ